MTYKTQHFVRVHLTYPSLRTTDLMYCNYTERVSKPIIHSALSVIRMKRF